MKISPILISIVFWLLSFLSSLIAQTPAEVRSAFKNLRSDHIKHNCGHAMAWLFAHRDALRDQMLQELYVTDPQGRDALLFVLFNTESFVPDDRFRRLVIDRLTREDNDVRNGDIEDFTKGLPIVNDRGSGLSRIGWPGITSTIIFQNSRPFLRISSPNATGCLRCGDRRGYWPSTVS